MTYRLNKTDGELLVDLVDGQIDQDTTDITLIGRNYQGFGEYFNENLIKMLENFANTAAPSNPLNGQLWYDTSEQRLKIFNGTTFTTAGNPIVSNVQPQMVAGDLWIDNNENKLYFFDGEDLVLVGPEYSAGQGKTGFEVSTVVATDDADVTILKLFIGGVLVGILSRRQFTPQTGFEIAGFNGVIREGFNPVESTFEYRGTASSSRQLIDGAGNTFTSANFLLTNPPTDPVTGASFTATTGQIKIKNSGGLTVGVGDTEYALLRIRGQNTSLTNNLPGRSMEFRVRDANAGEYTAIFAQPDQFDTNNVLSQEKRVGIFTESPATNFEVNGNSQLSGDLLVTGNLTVQGDQTILNTSILNVEDRNIVIANVNTPSDLNANNAGIIIKGTTDKTILYDSNTNSLDCSETINIASGKEIRYNDLPLLNDTTLGSSVSTALGLTQIGTLVQLNVDDIRIDGATISRQNGNGLNITANGTVTIDNNKITGVTTPTTATDVANKQYVDTEIDSEPVVLQFDITGLSNVTSSLTQFIEDLYPSSGKEIGTIARVHTTSYTNSTVSGIDIQSIANISKIQVDSAGTQNESVVKDINFDTASGVATLAVTRALYIFTVNSAGAWEYTSNTPYV